MASLLKRQLATEQPTNGKDPAWRREGDQSLALVITDAGRAAIGLPPADVQPVASTPQKRIPRVPKAAREVAAPGATVGDPDAVAVAAAAIRTGTASPKLSKRALLLKLMRRKRGATLEELIAATGWLPHSVRGELSTLRKRGTAIGRMKRGANSVYCVVDEAG